MDNKKQTAFLPKYSVSVPYEGETATQLEYKADMFIGKEDPKKYMGMMPYNEPSLDDVKSVVFATEPTKTINNVEQEKEKSAWDEEIENRRIGYNIEPEKRGVVTSALRGIGSVASNIPSSLGGIARMGGDAGVKVAELVEGKDLPEQAKQQVNEEMSAAINNVTDAIGIGKLQKYLAKDERDKSLAYDLGSLLGSLGLVWGVSAATKSVNAASAVFGVFEGTDIYTLARDKGVSPGRALALSLSGGVGTAMLEKWGLQNFLETYTFKSLKGVPLKIIAKQMGVEGTQEFSQSMLSSIVRADLENGWQWIDWLKQASYEGLLGATVSPVVGGIKLATTKETRNKWSKVFQEKGGMNKDDADYLAQAVVLNPEDATKHATEILNNEAITQAMMSPEEKSVVLKEGEDLLAKLLDQKALGLSDENQAIVDQEEQKLLDMAISQGIDEKEAESVAKLGSQITRTILADAKEAGLTEEQIAEEFNFDITNAEDTLEKVAYIDENGRYVGEEEISIEDERKAIQEAYREEEVASLMASGMSEDEARFRVETGREPTDFDRAIGFNYIPYQTEEFTEEENQALEIMNNPDREQIVANMSEEERRNFTALEQSVKNKELYNQSIDLQKEMNDIDRAEFDAGVPMWDKDTININGVERAVTNSSGKKIAHSEKSLRMFYEWFGDSKVVDEQGRPLVVYHGTDAEFNEFKKEYAKDGQYKQGFFFTSDKSAARMFGDIIMPVYLKAETDYRDAKKTGKEIDYIHPKNDDRGIYIVFNPNQIKSTSNTGTFSKASDNIRYMTQDNYIRVDEPTDLQPYETFKSETIKRLQEEYDNILVWNEEHKAEIEQAEKDYEQQREDWKQRKIDKVANLQNLADNNPDSVYLKYADLPNVTVEDLKQGKIKGTINASNKIRDLANLWGDRAFSEEVREFMKDEPEPERNRELRARDEFYIRRLGWHIFDNTYLGKKGKTPFSYANVEDGKVNITNEMIDSEPILKEIRAILKKDGWDPYHTSGKRVGSSSSYYRKNGYTLRLSNHELPMTAARQYNTDMGFRHGWDFEYILDSTRDMLDYYAVPTKEDFRKLFYKKSGIAEEYNEKIDYEQSKSGEARYQVAEFNPKEYFERKDVKENIEKSKENFSKSMDEIISGTIDKQKEPIVLFKPTEVWLRVGLPNRKISFSQSKIKTVMKEHNLTSDDLKKIPELLANPEYVFESKTDEKAFVAIVDKNIEPYTVVVSYVGNGLKIKNIIKSAYNKDANFIKRETNAGRLLYDKKKPMEIRQHRASIAQAFIPSDTINITSSGRDVNSPRYQTEAEEKNLVVTHGTTLEKLEEALRLGAMPMPSLAVTKSELATGDQYGEITFVGGYDIINPNKDKANKTFTADIYSPRREKPEYELNSDGIEYIKRQTGNVSKKGDSYWTSNIEYTLNNGQDYLLKEVYLASIGKISDLDGSIYSIVQEMTDKQKADFKKWKNKLINEYTDKKIFKGYTPSGKRKYVPYDLKNILQELRQKALRGSEEGMGGTAHALRGVWADELKNIEEIRKRKDKLVDTETYKKLDNIIWDETAKLTDLLVSEKLAKKLANSLVDPEEYMIEEALKLIKPSSNIANILAKADLRSDKKAVDAVKKYMTLLKNTPVQYFESKPARAVDFYEFEGVLIPSDAEYDAVARELEEQGVKQVLRYGSKEEKNQLINRMQKVFFQTSGDGGERKPLKPYKRHPLKVMGQYEPTKKMITLFKGRNPTTLVHEMGHHYLPIHLRLLEKAGKWDKLKPLYQELGISSVEQMGRDAEEKLIDMFTSYIYYNEAPNVETQSIFERAKQWMINAYNTVKNFVKPSEEVTKFFDELIAGEENAPDVSHLVGKEAELSKILQGARHGQELTINGLSMKDIAILRQALHARVPRRGRSLADVIRQAGGIDSRSEIAKALGYDSRKGGEMGFWNYRGTIDNEQALIELLVAEGFLFDVEQDSAEGVQAVWNKVEQLINNRDTTFSEAEQMQNEKREQAYKVQELVNNILVKHYNKDIKTLEEDMKAVTKKLADIGAVAVDKATLEYLQNSLAKMSKDYRNLLSEKKEKQYKYQEELTKFIKSSPLNNKDKLKLIDKIRMVKDERTFEKYLGEAKSQIEKYVEAESKRVLDDLIQKEIKSSRPRKAMAQLYNYENNKLFADLREWNKLNQDNAEAMAIKLDEVIAQGGGELSRSDKLRRMFLEYKTFGKDCSVEFMQALHDEIKAAKQAGIDAKDDADFMRAFEREQERQDVLNKLKESTADKNKISTKVANAYRRGISNLYSMLNSIAGKEIAEKYEFETLLEHKETKEWNHLKETSLSAQSIYKSESYGDLLNVMADKGKSMFTLYKKAETGDPFAEVLDENFKYELSVLDLIDIYNSMKNKKTAEDYAEAYGAEQIKALLSNLTAEDKALGDMLMEDVNNRYKDINRVYINLYGMDLKKVNNYWMSSTEHSQPVDIYNDFKMQSTTPGFFKERTAGRVIPIPKNAWLKYQNHISQGYYMTEIAEKFKEMSEVFKSKRIENMIKNKFGEGVYNTLREQIESIGLNAQNSRLDDVSAVFQSNVNNWIGAKIAVNPLVLVGQLTSFTNYAVDVNTKAYLKNFAYALRHPKEAIDFMMKYHKDFLMHRYESGFNEAVNRFIKDATNANGIKFGFSAKAKYKWSNALSSLVRLGDMGAIVFGGYGQFKTMLDSGMSVEEAKQKFEFATLRSQQSGNAASISGWQKAKGVSRMFLGFKNTPMQYTRKIVDAIISLENGDISKVQASKILANYLLVQPALWVFVKNVAKDLLGLDDEDDEYSDGILEQILVNPIEAIPFASDLVKAGYKAATGERVYSVISMPMLDDVEKAFRKTVKEEKDVYDYADIIIPFIEMTTSAPVATTKRYAQKWFGEEE